MVPLSLAAKTFEEVQGAVAELTKDRILIGHAIQNDLKVCTLIRVTSLWCISLYNLTLARRSCSHIPGRKFAIRNI
jgi:DNA polymerase III epsilon subunit-like protein